MVNKNSKRLAKNTLLLYFRMILLVVVNLYTSRVILKALGVEDYGIYNVVGGVVAMFTILSGSLSSAISRFITFELGKGNKSRLKSVFCTAVNVQLMLIVIITILLETIGLWFLNTKIVLPAERLEAANWVFQFSVATFAVNLWSIPYNASIIAHEKMSAFAYISLFDAFAKLAVSFIILANPIDRLVYYGLLIMTVGVVQRFLYSAYCKRHFKECSYSFVFDRQCTKEMFGFAGWNFIGAASAVCRDQGGNIIINLFCGPTVNAARGVSMSINHAVSGFVKNFMVALNPQITKNYASGDFDYMSKLIFQGARLSYYILLVWALPILMTTPYLLDLWLEVVPEHSTNFVRLVLLFALSESISGPLVAAALATGEIRNYQIVVGGFQLLNLPIDYVLLKMGCPPETVFIVAIGLSIICGLARLLMLGRQINLSVTEFIRAVYMNVAIVSVTAALIPVLLIHYIDCNSFISFASIVAATVASTALSVYLVGCSSSDRQLIHKAASKLILKFKHQR